ncbi:hypothetical protein KP509_18G021300 [Ceratopteris richardii]|uniref:PHD-type domain-containing protein n=1 Tax=Ceratopteris richardii TaxID=49495 RepID=A0A8T2SQ42_CERRI|nr:hypothetical protein KP509_18G021300 [Ceratopteris richardii]
MSVEVLTCVSNLQSRCDVLEDATAIFGCAACCSGVENGGDHLLHGNSLEKNYEYSDGSGSASSGQSFSGHLHNSDLINHHPFLTSNFITGSMPSCPSPKRYRKRVAGISEDENSKKKNKTINLESSFQLDVTNISGVTHLHGAKERPTLTKSRKGKNSFGGVKSTDELQSSKTIESNVEDEAGDAEIAALEWWRCVTLLKSYGVINNPDLTNIETSNRCVPHPGYVGDGLLTKMCKICGIIEDSSNTVICDDCQEAFHLSCCVPRLTSKYFKREDSWFCGACRKHRRKMTSKPTEKSSSQDEHGSRSTVHNESKARLGPAHQAVVPEWQKKAQNDDAERFIGYCIGMEIPYSEEDKLAERDNLLKSFTSVESLGWLSAEKVPPGTIQNWVKCNNVIRRSHTDSDGQKQSEIICNKWRRAPLNVEQTDEWECFCAMEWDPLHADCAIAQECSDEDVLNRLSYRMQPNTDVPMPEAGGRKSTLRQAKVVPH